MRRIAGIGLAVGLAALLAVPLAAQANAGDEALANEFIDCSIIASYMTTVPKPSDQNYDAVKRGWELKTQILNGAARLLTSVEYARRRSDISIERFLVQSNADKNVDVAVQFRRWMDRIDSCDAKIEVNKQRLMKLAAAQK